LHRLSGFVIKSNNEPATIDYL